MPIKLTKPKPKDKKLEELVLEELVSVYEYDLLHSIKKVLGLGNNKIHSSLDLALKQKPQYVDESDLKLIVNEKSYVSLGEIESFLSLRFDLIVKTYKHINQIIQRAKEIKDSSIVWQTLMTQEEYKWLCFIKQDWFFEKKKYEPVEKAVFIEELEKANQGEVTELMKETKGGVFFLKDLIRKLSQNEKKE